MNATIDVTVDIVNASSNTDIPSSAEFQRWTETALAALAADGIDPGPAVTELSIRVVDADESAQLNAAYRQKQGPTNILSFPFAGIAGTGIGLLGDLAICAPLVVREAQEQHKPVRAHWAHLTVHGVLHLSGYDHEEPVAAGRMEALEIGILDTLGFGNPYASGDEDEPRQ